MLGPGDNKKMQNFMRFTLICLITFYCLLDMINWILWHYMQTWDVSLTAFPCDVTFPTVTIVPVTVDPRPNNVVNFTSVFCIQLVQASSWAFMASKQLDMVSGGVTTISLEIMLKGRTNSAYPTDAEKHTHYDQLQNKIYLEPSYHW